MKKITIKATARRAVAVFTLFSFFAIFLLVNIFRLDYLNYEYYKQKTYDQVTTSAKLTANRGNIYDSNMNLLAKSSTVWRIFVSTKDIKTAEKKSGKDYKRIIADGLSPILSMDSDGIYKKIAGSSVLDVTIKKTASEEEYRAVLNFIGEKGLEDLLFTEAQTSRSYPNDTLAAHVLGFTGSDNQGLYGLEYYYDDVLAGEDGYYVYAKDAGGNALDTEYSSYFPATDGYSIVTTLDSYVQGELEAILETVRVNHSVNNRVCGVVMDTKTGAILAMATSSPFNPNEPFTLDAQSEEKLATSGYIQGTKEYNAYKSELLQVMWSNKAVSETYEPGSTFKIVTVSAALDSGAASLNNTFSCRGYYEVGGWRIRCHKITGHGGGFNLAYGLQMSCNPCMIALSERIGASRFYDYVEKFGYFEKTGIDLPSEASTIFHKEENLGATELATASFGQRFKVTPITQLVAIAAVANGGVGVTPHLLSSISDEHGKVLFTYKTSEKDRIISEKTASLVASILEEGVSGNGGSKNAYADGYRIAAKTGTSEKFDVLDANGHSYLRVGSCVAFAPFDNAEVAVIFIVDEPTSLNKYGSVTAAPFVSSLMETILPYLGIEKEKSEEKVEIPDLVGLSVSKAKSTVSSLGLPVTVIGNGESIVSQSPAKNECIIKDGGYVILYTEEGKERECAVPAVVGKSLKEASLLLTNAGLNVRIRGAQGGKSAEGATVVSQSLPPKTKAKEGAVIEIFILHSEDSE